MENKIKFEISNVIFDNFVNTNIIVNFYFIK